MDTYLHQEKSCYNPSQERVINELFFIVSK